MNRHFRSRPNFRYYYYSIQFGCKLFRYYLVLVQQIMIIFVIVNVNKGHSPPLTKISLI